MSATVYTCQRAMAYCSLGLNISNEKKQ